MGASAGTSPIPLYIDYAALGKLLAVNGWNDMNGNAAKFISQDGEYRVYQPGTKPSLDANGAVKGTTILVQLDNIRTGADDHCYVTMDIDLNGELTSEMEYTWGNTRAKIKATLKAAVFVAKVISDLADAWVASNMFDFLAKVIDKSSSTGNPGGRVNFNAVVSHTTNKILQCTRSAT